MASLYLSHNPNPNLLCFTSKASPWLRFHQNVLIRPKTNQFRVPVCRVSPKLVFPNLQADDFRHPLDREISRRFRALSDPTESEEALKAHFLEEERLVENDDTFILVGPSQHSNLYELLAETSEILNVGIPLLYVRTNPIPCARTVPLNDKPFVVVHTGLLDLLTVQELQVVFAHELAHLKCDHYLVLKVMDLLVQIVKFVPTWLIFLSPLVHFFRWGQAAELSCDRASLLVAQDPKVVISAIMKLTGGCSLIDEPDVDAYLAQAHAYVGASPSSPTGKHRDSQATRLAHPVPKVRAYEIDLWSRSKEYAMLLSSATD
ncbi:plastoglobule-localized metallopeptidase 48, chloroplastic-like [Argentina anserina]|uniref:plastoglobule-localized metallopeptidase 48, chloroplastic-like n=1 Tax=Argentina anserina TaxID=57926 RepID=UPI0021767FD3|nr:plastoglobule-localized metallopeptidase 48, chloroplastic-like [Potentilla anserina]